MPICGSQKKVINVAQQIFLRLTSGSCIGRLAGAISDDRWLKFDKTRSMMVETRKLLESISLTPQGWASHGIVVQNDGIRRT